MDAREARAAAALPCLNTNNCNERKKQESEPKLSAHRKAAYSKGCNRAGVRFSWVSPGAYLWRSKLGTFSRMLGLTPDNYKQFLKEWFGKNWVYVLRPLLEAIKLAEFYGEAEAKTANRSLWIAEQPKHLDVAVTFGFQSTGRAHPVQITVEVKFEQGGGIIRRTPRGRAMSFGETQRVQIELGDKGIEEADGIFGGDVIFQSFREEQRLGAIQTSAMIHA